MAESKSLSQGCGSWYTPQPKDKVIDVVKECSEDSLVLAKMSFFLTVAKQLNPFLTLYQTDKPMLAFLSGDMERLLRGLMERFIKPETMKEAKTSPRLISKM